MSNVPKLSRFVRGTLRFDSIHEITIHEPSSFLKRGHKLQSIRMIRVNLIESTQITTFSTHPQSPDYIFCLAQIDFRHVELTEGETICVDLMG